MQLKLCKVISRSEVYNDVNFNCDYLLQELIIDEITDMP